MTEWSEIAIDASGTEASAVLVLVGADFKFLTGDATSVEHLERAMRRADFIPVLGHWLDVTRDEGGAPRTLLVGCGTTIDSDLERWALMGAFVYDAMSALRLKSLRLPKADSLDGGTALERLLLGLLLRGYRLDQGRRDPKPAFRPERIVIDKQLAPHARMALETAQAVNRARAWSEQPANILTPPVWVDESRAVFAQINVTTRVIETSELEKLGAGALVAVGRGSDYGSRLLVAEWRGTPSRKQCDAVLVGKGLTFDAGGLNLKSRPNIAKMKFDMAGGAAVLGAIELAARRKSPLNIVAAVPMVENVIDGSGFRPGDVVKSLSGLTIEVVDTDAEGRLVLADAMTFAIREYSPTWLIDTATLTGAVMSVLHEEFAALYASDDRLANDLMQAGRAVGERLWRLPLDPSQDYLVESEVADVRNLGKSGFYETAAGSPTAGAKFLEKFATGTLWAHIDLTGAAWSTRSEFRWGKGATGFGVRLLDQWLSLNEPDAA
jgi:leucyl aminopeptidase